MKTFKEWFEENYDEKMPTGTINGGWFADHDLPMIVSCCCCGTTMALPSALIDEDGCTVCNFCGGDLL